MSFKAIKFYSLLALTALLTACGGGGGGGNDSGFNPPGSQMTATAQQTSVAAGRSTDIVVRFTSASGAAVNDGVAITASVAPSAVGSVVVVNPAGEVLQTATGTTSGGQVTFRFIGHQPGNATVSFSAQDPNAAGRTVTANASIAVTAGQALTTEVSNSTIAEGGSTDVAVRLTNSLGNPVADGTVINATVNPSAVASVFGVNASGGVTQTASAVTNGGVASFRIVGQAAGSAVVTFSAEDPNVPGRSVSASVNIVVVAGAARISMEATRTTLPINTYNIRPFFGSPYMSEVTITVRDSAGNPVNEPDGVQVSINPVGPAGFSTLDDGTTADVNEFLVIMGQGPVDVVAGRATVFVHSENQTGTSVLTATTVDPLSGQTYIAQIAFEFVATLTGGPEEVIVSHPNQPAYVQGSGANTAIQLEVLVLDGIGQPIGNPEAGNNSFNNVQAELISTGGDAGRLIAVNAAGQQQSGSTVVLRTNSGVGNLVYRAGVDAGQYRIRVTTDRADNNVDNGISDPVVGETTVTVSDGKLFSLQITSPVPNAILVNRVDPTVTATIGVAPPDPNGSYSFRVSVLATDRQGNPVPPGTEVQFGLVDDPVVGFPSDGPGFFAISDFDGNPEEAGFNFSAATPFSTPQFPFGPGDTLLVFGEEIPADRDLESARTVNSVQTTSSLTVLQQFNRNDDSGAIVDNGAVLPYVIGRATDGTITARATTNAQGVASVTLNYPVVKIGKTVAVWARATATDRLGNAKLITDIETYTYPGIAPAVLTASPEQIPANRTSNVTLCYEDAIEHPIAGVRIRFAFEGALGTVDGQPGNGFTASTTGLDGCLVATVTTTGVVPDQEASVSFFAGESSATVEIVAPGNAVLQAIPSAVRGDGIYTIGLRLLDGNGNPLRDVQLSGNCTGGGSDTLLSIVSGPGVTNATGNTTATIQVVGFYSCPAVPNTATPPADNSSPARPPVTGTCTFTTSSGTPTTTVRISSIDGSNIVSTSPIGVICPG